MPLSKQRRLDVHYTDPPLPFDEVRGIYNRALEKRQAGELTAAWFELSRAVNEFIWAFYVKRTGRSRCGVRDADRLMRKLVSHQATDAWLWSVVTSALAQPKLVQQQHFEILDAIFRSFCLPQIELEG